VIAPRLVAVPALAAVLVLLAGCAGDLSDVKAQKSLGQPPSAAAPLAAEPSAAEPSAAEPSAAEPSAASPSPSALPPPSGLPTPGGPDAPARRVESSGISFDVPKGWLELKAADIAAGLGDSDVIKELADRSGLDPDQLIGMMKAIDLYLVSDEGAHAGFVDNINVVGQPSVIQNDSQLELALVSLGAKDIDVRHEATDAGDATVASYELDFSGRHAAATVIVVETGEGSTAVTVSASNAQTLQGLVRGVLGSMKPTDAPIS
jgi:hypothetical protein